MSFPWNQNLWLYARAQKFDPSTCSLHTRHRSGYFSFVTPTNQKNSSDSNNPLLLVQTTGAPSSESERQVLILYALFPFILIVFFQIPE